MTPVITAGVRLPERRLTITARHVVLGAMASRDWQPQHHDHAYARDANLPDIILNTHAQVGWFIAYATDWCGPHARIARWRLNMKKPIVPGASLVLSGQVRDLVVDPLGFGWAEFALAVDCAGVTMSAIRLLAAAALPGGMEPWALVGDAWRPPPLSLPGAE